MKFITALSRLAKLSASVFLLLILMNPLANAEDSMVNVYSLRQPFLVQPLFDAFQKETGIEVNYIFAKKGLLQRIKREGKNSPADILLTTDIGNLANAKKEGILQPIEAALINDRIPARLRDTDNEWFGLTTRARVIYASRDRVAPGEIKTYEDLADAKWKGKICTRSGKHPYNVALIASMIQHHGVKKTELWLRDVKANLARKPQGNDRAQVKAIKEGVCDLALGNSYYYGKMLTDKNQVAWANSARIIFPNQDDRGTHVNISGAGVAKYAPHKKNAIKFIEFLAGDQGQEIYADKNFEYPAVDSVQRSALVESWGGFAADNASLSEIDKHRETAVKLVDKVDFDG